MLSGNATTARAGTVAAKKYKDDVPEEVKKRRLQEIVDIHRIHALELNKEDVGKVFEVLIEGVSARNNMELYGRNTQNKVIVFPKGDLVPGTYANVLVTSCTSGTLIGTVVR